MADLINSLTMTKPTGTSIFNDKQATSSHGTEGAFGDLLKSAMSEQNIIQKTGEKALTDMATGTVKDLHQAALALNKAETSMKMMLEVRNKAINAYKEILRTQI